MVQVLTGTGVGGCFGRRECFGRGVSEGAEGFMVKVRRPTSPPSGSLVRTKKGESIGCK